MRRILKIAIPYQMVSCNVKLASTQKISPFQKYVMALIVYSKQAEWKNENLENAIEKVLGFSKSRLHLLKDELVDLYRSYFDVKNNSDVKAFEEMRDEKVAFLELQLSKSIKRQIVDNDNYVLLSSQTSSRSQSIFLPLFKGFEILYLNKMATNPVDIDFKANRQAFTKNSIRDIFYEYLENKKIDSNTQIKSIAPPKNEEIVWHNHEIEIDISNDIIKCNNENSKRIMNLIVEQKWHSYFETILNEEIRNLNLPLTKNVLQEHLGLIRDLKLNHNEKMHIKYQIQDEKIVEYFYKLEIVKYESNHRDEFQRMIVYKKVTDLLEFANDNANQLDDHFWKTISDVTKRKMAISFFSKNSKSLENAKPLIEQIDYPAFQMLGFQGKKHFLEIDKTLFHKHYFESLKRRFDKQDIQNYQKITNSSYQQVINEFDYSYKNASDVLFKEWDVEQQFFNSINRMQSFLNNKKRIVDGIDSFVEEIKKQTPSFLQNQSLFQQKLKLIQKQKQILIKKQALKSKPQSKKKGS